MVNQGDVLGNYTVIEELGNGGIAFVYKAKQNPLDRVVALKVLKDGLSERQVERFLQGNKAAANLKHNNIIQIYELGIHKGKHFMSMPYIVGEEFEQIIKDIPAQDYREILPYLLPVLEAVGYMHENRVVHCDLKPRNILVDDNDKPYVFDFDMGGTLDDELDEMDKEPIYGTLGFIAPERFSFGLKTDTRADIFSLGVILYIILTHKVPYKICDENNIPLPPAHAELIIPSEINSLVPKKLEEVCIAALEKDREKRIQTAEEFAKALEEFC